MPNLNWTAFEQLQGSAERNFEMLCRSVIRRVFGQYGQFAALAAQPGVEFHLRLQKPCELGEPRRWFGWQCRWYALPSGRALGGARKAKIVKALSTTKRELPGLTDWVLWTRFTLTRADQVWFYGLKKQFNSQMELHLWTADELESYLTGTAAILRETYFGELVLAPQDLAKQHSLAVAPIKVRWRPELHQPIDAERTLRRMLGELESWSSLQVLSDALKASAVAVGKDGKGLEPRLATATAEVSELARNTSRRVLDLYESLRTGDLDIVRERLSMQPTVPSVHSQLPRNLRSNRCRAALTVTNALADIDSACRIFGELNESLGAKIVAVTADAGCGKTELAAQITAANEHRPAGILLHGGTLHAHHGIDQFASQIVVRGKAVPSMEALIEAVNAAGQRASTQLPISIDALNEAEDPRKWKGLLASLNTLLDNYPYVMVICSIRTAFADEALPSEVTRLNAKGFEEDVFDAVRRYFNYYRINAADAELPINLLSHPLTLRLFCEVTNPHRDRVVGIEATPRSLTALFERYLYQVADRIAELAPRSQRYYQLDVRRALDQIGTLLLDCKTRHLEMDLLRKELKDDHRVWTDSIVRLLEQEGFLLRYPELSADTGVHMAIAYDALAGHVIADALLHKGGGSGLQQWTTATNNAVLTESASDVHALAQDIFQSIVSLVPRRIRGRQLWTMLNEPFRTRALEAAADLESTYLDADTVNELAALITQAPTQRRELFVRLWHTRGIPDHPLNANFLDQILSPMAVASRDLRWTEWLRRQSDEIIQDLTRRAKWWRETQERSVTDRLRAQWIMWTLTSTVRELRDTATLALYWYGRGDPEGLFRLTLTSLAANDPYISERMLGASYGVAMAYPKVDASFASLIANYLIGLRDRLFGTTATSPTSYWIARLYVEGTIRITARYNPNSIPNGFNLGARIPFAPGPSVDQIDESDSRFKEIDQILHMDFENYTLGRLFPDRSNYDMNHGAHRVAAAHVRGTAWALGWRENLFREIDTRLGDYRPRTTRAAGERYGKKYSWIGFYTYAGILDDSGNLGGGERLSDVDIDVSFPETPPPMPSTLPNWTASNERSDKRWICEAKILVPDRTLYANSIGQHQGPWIAVYGNFYRKDSISGRALWGRITALFLNAKEVGRLTRELKAREWPGNNWLPDPPRDYYTFAGEIPWHSQFGYADWITDLRQLYKKQIQLKGCAVETEILAHWYGWESYHSSLNTVGGALIPSKAFSEAFDLRGVPQSFNQALRDGTLAAASLGMPAGFEGRILYLREDLIRRYARREKKCLTWFCWGERELFPFPERDQPAWFSRARQQNAQVWRQVRHADELCKRSKLPPRKKLQTSM